MKKILSTLIVAAMFCVALPCASFAANSQQDEQQSDTWLTAKLMTTIALNRELSIFDVSANVTNAVATLTGEVDSDVRKNLAYELAKSIHGIHDVKNNIQVKEDVVSNRTGNSSDTTSFAQSVADLTTTASIKSQYLTNANVHGLAIDVDTKRDRVTLSGKVTSSVEKELAEQIARNTSGVKDVTNNLLVQSPERS